MGVVTPYIVGAELCSGSIVTPVIAGSGRRAWTILMDGETSVAFVGNSFTQQFSVVPAMAHYVDAKIDGAAVDLGPPPVLTGTISAGNDGYYPSMTLAGMALYPAVDQRYGSGSSGTIDALDAIASESPGTYDFVVVTSGFVQEDAGLTPSTIGGEDVYVQPVRDIITELATLVDPSPQVIVRMTHEGYRVNNDTDFLQLQDFLGRQVLGARQLESEGIVVVPEHYIYSRLQGTVGGDGVPSYSALTHSSSSQPGNANVGWLSRTQGATGSFPFNTHLNAIASIVCAWIWGYFMWGIDPRGDTTFDSGSGLPGPTLDDFISPDGTQIYGGHNTGVGNFPFDTDINPSGPPDSEMVLPWNSTVRGEMQSRIVSAIDAWRMGTTEFDS